MIDEKHPDRNRFINVVLVVAAIMLMTATIYFVYSAWRTGTAQSRTETATRLMAVRTSPRSTETPGINAWISWVLLHGGGSGNSTSEEFIDLVGPAEGRQFPAEFLELLDVLRTSAPISVEQVEIRPDGRDESGLEFRKVEIVESSDNRFVLTSRDNLEIKQRTGEFAATATAHLSAVEDRWSHSPTLPVFEGPFRVKSARVSRFYVLNEDESLISLPVGDPQADEDQLLQSETDEFHKNPLSPSFVSNTFFFNFRFDDSLAAQAFYSGMYLDLGGLGLVASVTRPVVYEGQRCVIGADIAFEMDWEQFASTLAPDLASEVVHVDNSSSGAWNPWREFRDGYRGESTRFDAELDELAELESLAATSPERKSIYLANTRSGSNVTAIQVDRSTWLLLMSPGSEVRLPWVTMLLTGLVLAGLFLRIEQGRRRAITARQNAKDELQEKENLLNTMQVPLMVVDPNTDEIVYCNNAAGDIGMKRGQKFGRDVVADTSVAQDQYRLTHDPVGGHRRAYGVPIRVRNGSAKESSRHAIVRSVAVTAPIDTLQADERHRLGILFVVDEEIDLPVLLNEKITLTRHDEMRRLSGLMNHGIGSISRVLSRRTSALAEKCSHESTGSAADLSNWLATYLSNRIQLIAWTLEHWGRSASADQQRLISQANVERTVERLAQIFELAASDRELREQLHWNNGCVSGSEGREIVEAHFDWSEGSCFSVPSEGVFGFFLSEAFINAVRHGRPGGIIEFKSEENRARNEFLFTVRNSCRDGFKPVVEEKPYGGQAIMRELARLSGWSEPLRVVENGEYTISWTVPSIRGKSSVQGD
ncbi:MAG: hypothetical protein AAF456_20135 [Planctomycetota bacterium]